MKLFKKVAAAVLAGVMALSMVACGTTPGTNPGTDIPDPNPTLSEADQFFQMLNGAVELQVNSAKWKGVTLTAPKFENKLQDKAAAILDEIAAGVQTSAGDVTGYVLKADTVTSKKLNKDLNAVFVIKSATGYSALPAAFDTNSDLVIDGSNTPVVIDKKSNPFEFNVDGAKAYIETCVATSGSYASFALTEKNTTSVNGNVTAVELAHKVEFGVATKVINGQTCTILVWGAVSNT